MVKSIRYAPKNTYRAHFSVCIVTKEKNIFPSHHNFTLLCAPSSHKIKQIKTFRCNMMKSIKGYIFFPLKWHHNRQLPIRGVANLLPHVGRLSCLAVGGRCDSGGHWMQRSRLVAGHRVRLCWRTLGDTWGEVGGASLSNVTLKRHEEQAGFNPCFNGDSMNYSCRKIRNILPLESSKKRGLIRTHLIK